MDLDRVAVVIPSYNGTRLLSAYLPSVIAAVGERRVWVVDDASDDGSAEAVRRGFPGVQVLEHGVNAGYAATVNDGIRAVDAELVVILNNDVEVEPDFLESLLPVFEDETVFAAGPRILTPALGGIDDGAKTGVWHHGMFYVSHLSKASELTPVIFTSGGGSVYRRWMLDRLDCFDDAYSPFYWEDADLGYRAWKRGWRSVYQPASTIVHQHSATISRLAPSHVERVKCRNSLFFIWRNISDPALRRTHRRWLPLVLARRAASADGSFVRGWRDAFGRRKEASDARVSDDHERVLSDRAIFEAVGISV